MFDICLSHKLILFNPEKRHHHCLKCFNTEKGLHHFLRTLKVSNIEKGLHHFLETLKGLKVLKNDSVTFLWLIKFIKIAILQKAGEQPPLKVAFHITFMINKLHLLWVPSFIAIGLYFLFGAKFSWNEETDTCCNVECMLLGRNYDFLGGYLVATARYLSITTG